MEKKPSKFNRWEALLFPTLEYFKVNLIGSLGLNEMYALRLLLTRKSIGRLLLENPILKKVIKLYGIFLLSQIVSDIYNGSSIVDLLKGWAGVIFAILLTLFFAIRLSQSLLFIIPFLFGVIVRNILFDVQADYSSEFDLNDTGFFKFRFVPILNSFLLILSWWYISKRKGRILGLYVIFILSALVCVAFDSRSNGIFWIFTTLICSFAGLISRLTITRMVTIILIVFGLFQGIYYVYVEQVLSGNLGGEHSKSQLQLAENPYSPFSLLLAGRGDAVVAFEAIKEKPIFGHGSWAKDKEGKYRRMLFRLNKAEDKYYGALDAGLVSSIIPSHSVLLGGWMYSGVVGGIALINIFIICMKVGFSLIRDKEVQSSPYIVIVIFYTLTLFWTFLFSPLSHIKQTLPVMISFLLILNNKISINLKI